MSTSEKHRNSLVVPMERHISPVDYVAKDHSSRILVQTLSFILRQRIHLFWKFSKSFSSGKFLRDSGDSLGLKSAQSRSKELCKRIISTYSMFIRNAIIYVENSLTSEATVRSIRIPPSISESLCEVYKTYYFLKSLEIPDAYLHELWHTMEEGTNLFVKDVFHQTLSEVTILYRQETWIPHRDIPGISLLVDNFKMIIQGALSKIEPIRQNSPSTSKWLLDLATPHLLEAFRAFADSIHAIAFHSSPPITSRHLCILLRNTEFSRDSLLPDIWESFQIHLPQDFSPEIHGAFSEVIELFQNLESLLLDAYLCSKSLRITCVLRRGMLMSGKSPNTPVQFVYEARSFVMEVLLELVMVHEEFTTLAIDGGNFEVLTHLVDRIIDVLVDSMERLGEISVGLSVQLASELRLIQHVCVRFLSPSARRSLDELQSRVESMISDSNSERVEKVFRDSLRSSGLVHASLRPDVARRASIADLIH